MTGANMMPLGKREPALAIVLDDRDLKHEVPSQDEPMVISVVAVEYKIEHVLIDQGSSANILYWSTVQKMQLSYHITPPIPFVTSVYYCRTFHRLLRSPKSSEVVNDNSLNSCANSDFDPSNIAFDLEIDCDSNIANSDLGNFGSGSYSDFGVGISLFSLDNMANNDRTLKELATPYQAQSYDLKSRLIHLLPMFHGLATEDSHKHLKEFHVVCSTMRPHGIPKYHIKMKEFPFSLDGAGDMKRMFLEKFLLVSRTTSIKKEICGIR
ncbi:hypothetical protein CR513_26349, partial [Mucuna pruriens]